MRVDCRGKVNILFEHISCHNLEMFNIRLCSANRNNWKKNACDNIIKPSEFYGIAQANGAFLSDSDLKLMV